MSRQYRRYCIRKEDGSSEFLCREPDNHSGTEMSWTDPLQISESDKRYVVVIDNNLKLALRVAAKYHGQVIKWEVPNWIEAAQREIDGGM